MSSTRRHRAPGLMIGAVCLLAIASATALAGKGLKTKSETASVAENGGVAEATARCAKKQRRVSGGFESEAHPANTGPEIYAYASRKTARRGWTTASSNRGPLAGEMTSFAYCGKGKLKSTTESIEAAPENAIATVTVTCPHGHNALSGGFEAPAIGDDTAIVTFESRKQGKRKWTVSAQNASPRSDDLVAQVNCSDGKGLKTKQQTEAVDATSGTEDVELDVKCDRGQRVISGGFAGDRPSTGSLDNIFNDGPQIIASHKSGKRGWHVRGAFFDGQHELTAYAYCQAKQR